MRNEMARSDLRETLLRPLWWLVDHPRLLRLAGPDGKVE
jgi:hypothetical protein